MTGKDVAVKEKYAIMNPEQNVMEIIQLNLGGEALSISDLDTIKTPAGGSTMWTIPTAGDDEIVKEFSGVIIHSQIQRTYWEDEYSGKGQPPDCFSNDAVVGTGIPGGDCCDCPNDEFGSARKGKGKACSTKRIMFILREDSLLPTVLRVPVGSLKNSRNYLSSLSNKVQAMHGVFTEFGLEKATNTGGIEYAKITFKRTGVLTPEEVKAVVAYKEKILPYIDQAASVFIPEEAK